MLLQLSYPYIYTFGLQTQQIELSLIQLYLLMIITPIIILFKFVNITLTTFFKYINFKLHIIYSISYAFKFMILIAMLVFIRGGVPRYRYDYLTKIGWIKFLSILLSIFLSIMLLNYLF